MKVVVNIKNNDSNVLPIQLLQLLSNQRKTLEEFYRIYHIQQYFIMKELNFQ